VSFRIPEHEFNLVANPVILQHFQASHIWVSGKTNEGFVHFAILEGVQDDNLAPPTWSGFPFFKNKNQNNDEQKGNNYSMVGHNFKLQQEQLPGWLYLSRRQVHLPSR